MTKCKDRQSFTLVFTRFTLIMKILLHGHFTRFTTIKNHAGHSFTHPFTALHAGPLHALLHVSLHAASRKNENPRSQLHARFTHPLHAPPSPTGREGVRPHEASQRPNTNPEPTMPLQPPPAHIAITAETHINGTRYTYAHTISMNLWEQTDSVTRDCLRERVRLQLGAHLAGELPITVTEEPTQ